MIRQLSLSREIFIVPVLPVLLRGSVINSSGTKHPDSYDSVAKVTVELTHTATTINMTQNLEVTNTIIKLLLCTMQRLTSTRQLLEMRLK